MISLILGTHICHEQHITYIYRYLNYYRDAAPLPCYVAGYRSDFGLRETDRPRPTNAVACNSVHITTFLGDLIFSRLASVSFLFTYYVSALYLEERVGFAHGAFVGWARSEVTRPVSVRIIGVGEKIISLGRPWPASGLVVDSLDVTAGCRVKQVDPGAQLVSVPYHFIHILKVHVSFL